MLRNLWKNELFRDLKREIVKKPVEKRVNLKPEKRTKL